MSDGGGRTRVLFLAERTAFADGKVPPHGLGAHVAATLAGLHDHFDVRPVLAESEVVVAPSGAQRLRRLVPRRLRGLRHDLLVLRSDRRFAARAIREAEVFRPEVVYERNEYLAFAGITLARRHRIPYVLEVNGLSDRDARAQYRSLAEPFGAAIERFKFARAATVVVESPGMATALGARGVDAAKIVVVPNSVPLWKVRPNPPPARAEPVVVGWIGHLMPWYLDALELLVEAAVTVVRAVPGARFHIVAGGPGSTQLLARIDEVGLRGSFELRGAVEYERVPDVLEEFDIGVVPAAFDYQFPVKLVEMGGAGLAVVAPRTSGIEGLLAGGREYEPFAPGDAGALARALLTLATDPARRARLGAALHKAVNERFTWPVAGHRLAEAVRRVTPARPAGS